MQNFWKLEFLLSLKSKNTSISLRGVEGPTLSADWNYFAATSVPNFLAEHGRAARSGAGADCVPDSSTMFSAAVRMSRLGNGDNRKN